MEPRKWTNYTLQLSWKAIRLSWLGTHSVTGPAHMEETTTPTSLLLSSTGKENISGVGRYWQGDTDFGRCHSVIVCKCSAKTLKLASSYPVGCIEYAFCCQVPGWKQGLNGRQCHVEANPLITARPAAFPAHYRCGFPAEWNYGK